MDSRLNRFEDEMRKEVKEIHKKVGNIELSVNTLVTKQNTGLGIFKYIITIIVAIVCGFFGSHLSR